MRKVYTIVLALITITCSVATAQVDYNKWSVGLNVGGHYGSTPSSLSTKTASIAHYGLNGRYMMNNRVGIMLDAGLDTYKYTGKNLEMKSNYFRTSLQGVMNVGDILKFDTWTKCLGLMVHAGAGVSVLTNHKDTREKYNIGKRQDLMLNGIVGITPQVKLGERVSLNLDFSFITNVKQNWNYDMRTATNPVALKNTMVNWSLGATFYLGKNASHADWKATSYGAAAVTPTNNYEQRIQELEHKIQEDIQQNEPK